MTLQQLKYIVTVAEKGTFSKAAKSLFLSQPSLTKAIKELEKEMGVVIFDRTNKGVSVSKEGEIFLGYARQVLEQATLLEEKYKTQAGGKQEFRVSTQHYSFAVNAFAVSYTHLVNSFGSIAMAGYTAANNIFGFLYAATNSITQACMSFTSQNYGVGKLKRMDRVLFHCMILTIVITLLLGGGTYIFGHQLLGIYTCLLYTSRCV